MLRPSILKMEHKCVYVYQTKRRHNPETHNPNSHRCDNRRSHSTFWQLSRKTFCIGSSILGSQNLGKSQQNALYMKLRTEQSASCKPDSHWHSKTHGFFFFKLSAGTADTFYIPRVHKSALNSVPNLHCCARCTQIRTECRPKFAPLCQMYTNP